MRAIVLLPISVAALALCACSKSQSSSPPGSCGTATAATDAPFCYTLPAGFTQKGDPIKREGWIAITFANEEKAQVTFISRNLDSFDRTWKALQGNATTSKAADVKEEELAGGKGKILTYTTPEKEPRFVISVLLRGAKSALECEAEYRVSTPKPELLDTCKSVKEP